MPVMTVTLTRGDEEFKLEVDYHIEGAEPDVSIMYDSAVCDGAEVQDESGTWVSFPLTNQEVETVETYLLENVSY